MWKVATKVVRGFGGLRVRYKLMVLHNLFYLALSVGVYFAVVPMAPEARLAVLAVLGLSYCLAVLILEGFVMRLYIYQPLKRLLDADEASRRGETDRELIDESSAQDDELGQLIRSRNATVRQLRMHERELEQTATDLRRKNELLATAKRNLADQDRLASLGMLTAGVAHELNTPLAVLLGSVERLLEKSGEPPSSGDLERMLRVTRRLRTISESLLYFARVRKMETEPLRVRALAEEAWSLVAIDAKAVQVEFINGAAGGDWVMGNSDRLVQLFVNLLRNALLAVEAGGRIEVRSRRWREDGREWVGARVEDNGPGIPADVLPDVFEAFVTTRLDSRGTGLGLTVAEGIAHQHGGTIVASNRPEGGACLEARLPAAGTGGSEG